MSSGLSPRNTDLRGGALAGLRSTSVLIGFALVLAAAAAPLSWQQQAIFGAVATAFALAWSRLSSAGTATLTLILVSCVLSLRYVLWRALSVFALIGIHRQPLHPGHLVLPLLLLLAEIYAVVRLLLGYLQMAWPLKRPPVPLTEAPRDWPAVDLLIPTLNEPLAMVKFTALAALNLDWPPDRLRVHVLDDGRREAFRAFCAEAGIGYMVRDDKAGAKAGNLNRALQRLDAPFVAVFDADHVPVRSFLQMTMGSFERDLMLGLLQTPQHLYSPDPFERNLHEGSGAPGESELFHAVVQDGNDLWNAAFFTGTGAVLRRAALESVGGFAEETIAEDVHTSLRMQQYGWNSAYLNLPLAAGLSAGTLGSYLRQRMRWARGMLHLTRLQNPLLAGGLSLTQRLCYFHATAHFLFAFPRLIYLLAPFFYLGFGRVMLPGYWAAILAFAVPHLALAVAVNARLHGPFRFSFWSDIYETVAAPFLLLPTLLAFLAPSSGRFGVTPKNEVADRPFFDARSAWPLVLLFCLNVLGLLCAAARTTPLLHALSTHHQRPQFFGHFAQSGLDPQGGAIWINVLWTCFNLMILSVAIGAARQDRQRRRAVRLPASVPAGVVLPDGHVVHGATADVSSGGLLLHCERPIELQPGDLVSLVLPLHGQRATLPATIVASDRHTLRVQFDPLTLQEEELLALLMFAPADRWARQGTTNRLDAPFRSLANLVLLACKGLFRALQHLLSPGVRRAALAIIAGAFVVGGLVATLPQVRVRATEASPRTRPSLPSQPNTPGRTPARVTRSLRFDELAGPAPLLLTTPGPARVLHFDLPVTEVVVQANLRLRYLGLLSAPSHLSVTLNGVPAEVILPTQSDDRSLHADPGSSRDLVLPLAPELLVSHDELRLQLEPPPGGCLPGVCSLTLDPGSELELSTRPVISRPLTSGSGQTTAGSLATLIHNPREGLLHLRPLLTTLGVVRPLALSLLVCLLSLGLGPVLAASLRERASRRLQVQA